MLTELRVAGLGVLDECTIDLGPGLNVVTGETGAGKSMLIRALGLLGGARADPSWLREDAPEAEVEGCFALTDTARDVLAAAGIACDEDDVVIARRLRRSGSRAYVNGRIAAAAVLVELGGVLVESVGQHSAHSLLHPSAQRHGLDRFGGDPISKAAATTAEAHDRLRAVTTQRAALGDDPAARARELDMVTFQLDEIEVVSPDPGEDAELATLISRLTNAESIRADATEAGRLVAEARDLLGTAGGIIARIDDPACADIALAVAEATGGTDDAAAGLRAFAETCDSDPQRLELVNRRMAEVKALSRKYGPTLAEVLAFRDEAVARRAALVAADQRCVELDAEARAARADLERAAAALSEARRAAGARMGEAILARLHELAFTDPSFEVAVGNAAEIARHGGDVVAYRFSASPAMAPGPIDKVASGGELSRLMLALACEMADADAAPTIVFDEIDAGTGGETAVAIGESLGRLAGYRQVVCVTHLAQIAAVAECHVRVARNESGTAAASAVDGDERITELSRMLSGSPTSTRARRHAAELVRQGPSQRRQPPR